MSVRSPAKAVGVLAVVAIGLVVGAASAIIALKHVGMGGEEYSGWSVSRVTGSAEAGPLLRARVALTGLLALNRSQAHLVEFVGRGFQGGNFFGGKPVSRCHIPIRLPFQGVEMKAQMLDFLL